MWNVDETESEYAAKKLATRLPGIDEYVIDHLAEDDPVESLEKVSQPWYAVVDRDSEIFIYSELTKEALAGFLMEEIFMGDTREDEVLGIFHDGKAVYWKLDLLIGD